MTSQGKILTLKFAKVVKCGGLYNEGIMKGNQSCPLVHRDHSPGS